MGQEIERKFLVNGDGWRAGKAKRYRQGYLSTEKGRTVRVRLVEEAKNDAAWGYLTIKGKSTGASRPEYEYAIPAEDARELLDTLCHQPLIEKVRYTLPLDGATWEVDEFFGINAGLIVAEIELTHPDQPFTRPAWLGAEVTDDPRYFNSNLVAHPFTQWQ